MNMTRVQSFEISRGNAQSFRALFGAIQLAKVVIGTTRSAKRHLLIELVVGECGKNIPDTTDLIDKCSII